MDIYRGIKLIVDAQGGKKRRKDKEFFKVVSGPSPDTTRKQNASLLLEKEAGVTVVVC
jgi:hypothetical protein